MKRKPKDRHLDTPSEANRDKHINFVALENEEADPSDQLPSGKLAVTYKKNKKRGFQEPDKKGNSGKVSFLGLSAMTLLFCSFIYFLILKAVALLLTIA